MNYAIIVLGVLVINGTSIKLGFGYLDTVLITIPLSGLWGYFIARTS
jgi:hypothetical protein